MTTKGFIEMGKHELRANYERACEDFIRRQRDILKGKESELYYYHLLCAFKKVVLEANTRRIEKDAWGIDVVSEKKEEFADDYEKLCYEFLYTQRVTWDAHDYKPEKSYLVWAFEKALDRVRKEDI